MPFAVPLVAGTVAMPDGGRAGVHRALDGEPIDPAALVPGPGLPAALGRALAAVHDLPVRLVEDAELPVYTAAEYRNRRLAEVDRAAATGHVPGRAAAAVGAGAGGGRGLAVHAVRGARRPGPRERAGR